MSIDKTQYKAPALEKGLDILEFLSKQREPQTISEITEAVSRSRNELYRMLMVLEQRGYLLRSESGDRITVSNKLFELGIQKPPTADLHAAALPEMQHLADDIHQSAHLVVASADQMVCVARVESPGQLGFSVRVGFRRPLISSTSGVVLYGFLPEIMQKRWINDIKPAARDKAEVAEFLAHADEVRSKGYIILPSGFVDGVQDIAAPIFGASSAGAAASLTVPFVSGRSAKTSLATAADKVVATARTISSMLIGES